MSTPTQDTAPDIARAFLLTVIERYEGYGELKNNLVWLSLKSDQGELIGRLHSDSTILSNLNNNRRIIEACADKLHATVWQIYNRTVALHAEGKITRDQRLTVEKMQTYVAHAFSYTNATETTRELDAELIAQQANTDAKREFEEYNV